MHCLLCKEKENHFCGEIITCGPSIYTMDHPDLTVLNFIENSISLKRVKNQSLMCWLIYSVYLLLSYDGASGSEITQCNKIDKPLVVYRFMGNVMTSTTTLRT